MNAMVKSRRETSASRMLTVAVVVIMPVVFMFIYTDFFLCPSVFLFTRLSFNTKRMSVTSAQEAFAPHYKEISRRRDVTQHVDSQAHMSQFEKNTSDSGPTTFVLEDQCIVLMSIAHRQFAPRSPNQNGWVRLYGAFETADDARAQAQAILCDDPGVSMLMIPTHEWICIASSPERFADTRLTEQRRDEMLEMNRKQRERDAAEFQEHKQRAIDGGENDDEPRITEVTPNDSDEEEATTSSAEVQTIVPKGAKKARGRLSAAAMLAGQRIAAISLIVPEDDAHGELLLKVYACFDTMAEADVWVRNAAAPRVQDVHIDIIDLGRWIEPASMKTDKAPKEVFRQQELDKIMSHRKEEPTRVEEYKDWKKKTDPCEDENA